MRAGAVVLLGDVADGVMRQNDAGGMVESVWNELPEYYHGVQIDTHIVMPNHFHGIIMLNVGAGPCGRPDEGIVGAGPSACPDEGIVGAGPCACPNGGHPRGGAPTVMSLPDVVHRLKSLTTARYRHGVQHHAWPPFPGRLWQRNYHERIIRDDAELAGIREYIRNNPANWVDDEEYQL